jgi:hypothetical protein
MPVTELICFKAYDIRGRLGENLEGPIIGGDRRWVVWSVPVMQ